MSLSFPTLTRFALAGLLVGGLCAARAAAPADSREKEQQQISILQSGAPPQDKAVACKRLAIYGSKDAVPVLAPLLSDPQLSSWCRTALEAIPGAEADEALRNALNSVRGRHLAGVINSIGRRRDAKAVSALTGLMKDQDNEVASAAGVALGCIGGDAAAKALVAALPGAPDAVRTDIAEGGVRCAEHYLNAKNYAAAQALYDTVRTANVPRQRVLEATRGAILARQAQGLSLLLEQLRSADKGQFGIGLRTARELAGSTVTEALAAELERAPQERQPMLLLVLADRADPAALPIVQKAAQTGPTVIRVAAIGALDRMGSPTTIPVLFDLAADPTPEVVQAARVALARLSGKEVDTQILARLPKAAGKLRQVLIELSGLRQITAALPEITRSVADGDAGVRAAALSAVGLLGDETQAADLVKQLAATPDARNRADIEKALLAIIGRRGAQCQPMVLPLAKNADAGLRKIALHTLASVGGAAALETIKGALADADASVQDEAARTLSTWPNSWPEDATVAEPLLQLAREGKKTSHQVLGIRGYLQYVQGDKKLNDDQKLGKINELFPAIKRPEEKRQAIAAMGSLATGAALEKVMSLVGDEALTEDSCSALVSLASQKGLKGASPEQRRKALQTAVEKSASNDTKKKAEKALKALP